MSSLALGSLHFILQKNGQSDDTLVVTPDIYDDDLYNVKFVQRSIGNTNVTQVTKELLNDYLELFLRTLLIDEDGPTFVQIDVPLYPSVMVKPQNLPSYLQFLYKQLNTLERNWPTETPYVTKPVNKHTVFLRDDDDEKSDLDE